MLIADTANYLEVHSENFNISKGNPKFHPFYDVCPYRKNWNKFFYYNSLTQEWPKWRIWVNPPFSIAFAFLTKILIEWLSGTSVILLVPNKTINKIDSEDKTKFYSHILSQVSMHEKKVAPVAFGSHKTPLNSSLGLIYTLQFSEWDRIISIKSTKSTKKKEKSPVR